MNQPESPVICSESERYRIAHLSDLHFGRHFNAELWCYLEGLLQHEYRPDLIVVTGDIVDTPSLFGLGIAYRQLVELQRNVGSDCQLLFVPGNHDVGIFGNVALWPWRGKVRLVFHEKYRDHFKNLPTFIQHRNKLWWKRWCNRAGWTCLFAGKRAFAVLGDPGREAFPLIDEVSARVVIAGFDSNEELKLATGRVDSDCILSLQPGLNRLRERPPDRSLCPRIALVHHHPLPIPYSDTAESLTAFEPFLVFRNAGTFLHALARLHFDLVLHGHKHYWHFARLSFEASGSAASELVVIGAGSGTIKLEEPGRNSFNLIDIMPNGGITHRPVFYGKGMTTVAASHLDMRTEPRQIFSLDTIKSKAHGKGIARQGLECDLIERSIVIDDDGAADLATAVNGLRVLGEGRLSKVDLMIAVAIGSVVPAGVELTDTSKRLGHVLDIDRNALPTKALHIPINLGHDVYGDGEGVSYGVTCRMINTYSITEWENEQLPGWGANVASMTIRFPAKRLRLTVTLPSGLIEPNPEVVCERIKGYPLIAFDKDGFPKVERLEWIRDEDMTQHEQGGLKRTAYNSWTLEITEPMVGFRYDLRWQVKTRGREVPLHLRGKVDQLRRSLLSLLDSPFAKGMRLFAPSPGRYINPP